MRRRALALPRCLLASALLAAGATSPPPLHAQAAVARAADPEITSPAEQFGQPIGTDYFLATWDQLVPYWEKLATESDRMVLDTIGTTEEGRPQLMAIVTSPENHRRLDRYKEIARTLALAEVPEAQARRLSEEGRAIVWIDGGLHATEVLGAQQLIQTVYEMVSGTDAETLRLLDDAIMLFLHANPDGHALVGDWYMRHPDPLERSTGALPRLYEKYAGHDNNRDFYMGNLAETENMLRVMVREWFPQIVYNHHQTGPSGTVLFAPPFRGPANYNMDPLVLLSIDAVGAAMHSRFVREGKPGSTMRSGASYSTWWNGGLRTTPYYHNQIGLLTETIGHPTPIRIPFVVDRQLQTNDMPLPIEPQEWHFAQSVDYSLSANRAVLDFASRNREHLLFNIWRMGRNSIERGSRDHWTVYPHELAEVEEAVGGRGSDQDFERLLRRPEDRDPRAYIIPASQADFPTATKFVNALIRNGVAVDRARAPFTVGAETYPAGSFVVRAAQAFRPHVLDMFEPQDHPDDFRYPGGPPIAPYDAAGWTLAYQMGVEFDRILEGLPAGLPLTGIEGYAPTPDGTVVVRNGGRGYLLSHAPNDAFSAVDALLENGHEVHWLLEPVTEAGRTWPAGTFFVAERRGLASTLTSLAETLGLAFIGVTSRPDTRSLRLSQPRIGLVDVYGGSMDAGWVRFIFDSFDLPYQVVYPSELDAGDLASSYDALVFVPGLIPSDDGRRRSLPDPADIPAEYHDRLGSITAEQTIPRVREFLEAGGSVVAIGSSSRIAEHLGLAIAEHMVEETAEGVVPLAREEFYIPGSVLTTRFDTSHPLAHGTDGDVAVMFDASPVFRVAPGAAGVTPVGWFDADPLMSGWAWGQERLEGGVAALEARVGQGQLFLFGPEITFRGQAHEAMKLLFNGLYYGAAREGRAR